MPEIREKVDVCVIGAGHAGCEAALACAKVGLETVIFTVSVDSIALMPCNPNVGGSSKGHLVRELDALGGEMGKNIDKTFIQSKMLNVSKGPAVHSLRAQADKAEYSRAMRNVLENQDHLTIKQAEIVELLAEELETPNGLATKKITGVKTYTGAIYEAKAVILCTGTYLKARCLCGEAITYTGPNGLQPANYLTDSLKSLGVEMRRFKTGTPARMDKRSIDFSKMEEQFGDERVVPFSFSTNPEDVQIEQASCWLTYTNEKTHEIIRNNLDRSPIYAVHRIKEIMEEVKQELDSQQIAYGDVMQGVMIETPAAVMISEELAKEVDFFSIGTNDLTQYTLAIDRQNPKLDAFYDAHHPAVLRMIRMTVENAHKAGIWCGICGELGADTTLTEQFLRMGVDELSVSPGRVLPIRKIIRESNLQNA